MTTTGTRVMLAEPAYDLGAGLELRVVDESDAMVLGAMVASMEPWLGYPVSSAELTRFIGETETGVPRYGIRHRGLLAGTVVVRTRWLRGPYVQLLALAPATQGRGLGARILAFIEHGARGAGERNLWVAATSTNIGALNFYKRHGFVPVATLDGLVVEHKTELLLRKRLCI